jgi:soluble lytic murein transglycosylase
MPGKNHVVERGRTSSLTGPTAAIVGSLLIGVAAFPVNAFAADIPTSAPHAESQSRQNAGLPSLLSDADAGRYRDIFRAQAEGKWAEADRTIDALTDRLLLAPVEAQRYLSPTYRAKYGELRAWLEAYADASDANRIYALAMRRRPSREPAPESPVIGDGHAAAMRATTTHEHIGIGDEAASFERAPRAAWLSALEDWQSNRIDKARREFEAVSRASGNSPWTAAAAAFWAARAELRGDHPELFTYWLGIAAKNPRTFYGLLARRTLGINSYIDFDRQGFGEIDAQILTGIAAGRRALALVQIGETGRAETELRALALRASSNLLQSISALADRANMPSLSAEIAGEVADGKDGRSDRAQFPVPRWQPRGGFQVDRALIYGLMRQESKFKPVARNPSGAAGLMQLMPSTARTMEAHTGVHGAVSDPAVNLSLAQQYVIELLSDSRVNGNLLFFAVAYNRGPGALPRLKADAANRGDPLLFVENISSKETRLFIHQVLTNYWIYRLRLGQPTPDLDALAAGEWPIYTALDDGAEAKIRHAQN